MLWHLAFLELYCSPCACTLLSLEAIHDGMYVLPSNCSRSSIYDVEVALHLPLLVILQLYPVPPPLPLPGSNFGTCSLNAIPCLPAVVLFYWTFQGTILWRLKMFSLFFMCFNVLFMWKVFGKILKCSNIYPIVLVEYFNFVGLTSKLDLQAQSWTECIHKVGNLFSPPQLLA